MKIGEEIWYVTENGCPGYWQHAIIEGETSRSWLVLSPDAPDWLKSDLERWAHKIPKSGKGHSFTDQKTAERDIWALKHRYAISRAVEGINDAEKLKQIAEIIGYPLEARPTT